MGLFGNNSGEAPTRNPDMVFGFRALGAGYVLFLVYQIIQLYIKGEAGTELWVVILGSSVLGAGALFILISSFISWRKEKAAMNEPREEEPESPQEEEIRDEE